MKQEKQPLGLLSLSLSVESCIPYQLNFFPCTSSTGVRQHLREIEVNGVKLNHVPCHNIGSHVLLPAIVVEAVLEEARSMLSWYKCWCKEKRKPVAWKNVL